jgi:hypothetical protein
MEGEQGLAHGIPARLTAAEGRRFGLTVGLAFLALAGLAWWRGRVHTSAAFAPLGGLLVLAGLLVPTHLGPVYRAWMGLAHRMSQITTPVFLGIVFYLVLTPVGMLMRLFGGRPLPRPAKGATAWVPRAPDARRRVDMERQF